jgi:hypothetical protein
MPWVGRSAQSEIEKSSARDRDTIPRLGAIGGRSSRLFVRAVGDVAQSKNYAARLLTGEHAVVRNALNAWIELGRRRI